MTPSDFIALGALIVAAFTILFNYLINKENLRAKRENIAKEKSVEAYRKLIEKFLLLKFKILNKNLSQAINARDDCFYALLENRLYLPRQLHDDIGDVLRKFMKYTDVKNVDAIEGMDPDRWRQINEDLNKLIERLQIHIGVETEENLSVYAAGNIDSR